MVASVPLLESTPRPPRAPRPCPMKGAAPRGTMTPTTLPARAARDKTATAIAASASSSSSAAEPMAFYGDDGVGVGVGVGPVMLYGQQMVPPPPAAIQPRLFGARSVQVAPPPPVLLVHHDHAARDAYRRRVLSRRHGDHHRLLPAPAGGGVEVVVRDVWAHNLEDELFNIREILPRYPVVCIDTEFPGTVHDSATPRHLRTPRESYAVVKSNVDKLQLLQLGVALSGPDGRCPVVWQFNFRGFDADRDPHAPSSIAMLKTHGMDFFMLHKFGIDPAIFARAFYCSGLGCGRLTWAAFSGSYDFAYLAKMLTGGRPLPATLEGFLAQVESIFGPAVLDVKHLARFCGEGGGGIRGGLEQVAGALGVHRAAGRAHNAGSDSLLTSDVLRAMMDKFFPDGSIIHHARAIDGLVV